MDFRLPELGEGVYEAEMTRWLVKRRRPGPARPGPARSAHRQGDHGGAVAVCRGDHRRSGPSPARSLKVGQVILAYDAADAARRGGCPEMAARVTPRRQRRPPSPPANAASNGPKATVAVKAAPAVRQLAKELGVDLAAITGSGPDGRILIGDLPAAVRRPQPVGEFGRAGSRVKMQGLRRKIAEHMVQSKTTIPHYTYVDECDVTDLVAARVGLQGRVSRQGREAHLPGVLRQGGGPGAEGSADRQRDARRDGRRDRAARPLSHRRRRRHAGGADRARGARRRQEEPRRNRPRDRSGSATRPGPASRSSKTSRGGTFTVTSIGNLGGLFSTPIINHPQVGILGHRQGREAARLRLRTARSTPADMVYLSFSFDHRVARRGGRRSRSATRSSNGCRNRWSW